MSHASNAKMSEAKSAHKFGSWRKHSNSAVESDKRTSNSINKIEDHPEVLKTVCTIIDEIKFHHSIDIMLNEKDNQLQSLIQQEKKKHPALSNETKNGFNSEFTVIKFKSSNADITLKYVRINRISQDQRFSQDQRVPHSKSQTQKHTISESKPSNLKLSKSNSKHSICDKTDQDNQDQIFPRSPKSKYSQTKVNSFVNITITTRVSEHRLVF